MTDPAQAREQIMNDLVLACRIRQRDCEHGWKSDLWRCQDCLIQAALDLLTAQASSGEASQGRIATAAAEADWQQVVLNGGPPCFHLEDNRFCLRAQRWDGHGPGQWPMHPFVSLADLIEAAARESTALRVKLEATQRRLYEITDESDLDEALQLIESDYRAWQWAMDDIRREEAWASNRYPSMMERLLYRALKDRATDAEAKLEAAEQALLWRNGNADELIQLLRLAVDCAKADRHQHVDSVGGYAKRCENAERALELGHRALLRVDTAEQALRDVKKEQV